MKYSEKLVKRYTAELESWDWDRLKSRAELVESDQEKGVLEWRKYLGSICSLYPSGKIYAFWTTNQTGKDIVRDEAFRLALEAVSEAKGCYIDTDGDVFAVWPHEDELAGYRRPDGSLEAYAWPGGYPIFYMDKISNVLCPHCAAFDYGQPDDRPIYADVNYEQSDLYCVQCEKRIESAYGEE